MLFRIGRGVMSFIKNLGFMQGRLSPSKDGKIQFFPSNHWKQEFKLANALGLKNMEWTLDYKNLFKNPIFTTKGILEIRHLKKKYEINIKTLTGDCFMQKPFWKYKNSKKYLEQFKKIILACSNLEIKFIVFPLVDKSSIKNEKIEKKIISRLSNFTELLKEKKICILFESDYAPLKLKKFISRFDSSVFGINYDTGNSASLNFDPHVEFRHYGKYVKNIHIKDRLLKGKTIKLGEGNTDFNKIFKILKKIKYDQLLILQTARGKKNQDFRELKENLNFIKKKILN